MSIGSWLGSTSAHRPRREYPASLRWLRPASYPPRRHLFRMTTPLLRRAIWLHTSRVFLFYTTKIFSVVQYPKMTSQVVLTPRLRVRQQYPAVYGIARCGSPPPCIFGDLPILKMHPTKKIPFLT